MGGEQKSLKAEEAILAEATRSLDPLRPIHGYERSAVIDPDTTLEGHPFVTAEELAESGEVVETADVFALVAAYDHAVGSPTAPEFETYDEARDAGIVLLTVNANVLSFRIDKRTTRKA